LYLIVVSVKELKMRGKKLLKSLDLIIGTAVILILSLFKGRHRYEPPQQPKRILILKLAALGDTVLLIPSLRALRITFPNALITFIGTAINEQIARLYPQYIDEFKRLEVYQVLKHPLYFVRFIRDLRRLEPDIVFDFEQWSFITPILSVLSRAHVTIGFKIPGRLRHVLYSHPFTRLSNTHESQNFLQLLSIYGLENKSRDLELPVHDKNVGEVKKLLSNSGWESAQKLVIVHPGCGAHGFPREWPLESYRSLCKRLGENNKLFFVFTGNGVEERLTSSLSFSFQHNSVQWTESDVSALIALLSIADLVISGNNGVMHLTAALKRPQVALHGPTDSIKWGPLNPYAIVIKSSCPGCPCLDLGFEYHRTDGFCMAQITVEEILQVTNKLLIADR
jgi:ADP-heptose:LPS heptosyltransferase